jgi:multidrug efflux pump subunit AcrB
VDTNRAHRCSLIDGLALPNKALSVVGLKPFDERTDKSLSVCSALVEVNLLFQQIAAGNVIAFNLPPISGFGNAAEFELRLQTLTGATLKDLAAVAGGLVIAVNQNPALANVYTTYGASTPQVYLESDRERAETLGVSIGDIFSACRPRWAARISTTSIASAAPGRSRFRPTRQIARRSKISFECACAHPRVISSRYARSPMSS